ncbi:MAG TPA: nuclear transport factor 2 family protein [Solirubrobacteraceae bacterium]|nr:nuclear transport factor 2 family protein [Solirubrobacteraceae bacterium]
MASDYGSHGATEGDVATVQAIYDAFARRDLDGALAHVSDDVRFEPSGTARLAGRTEPYRGHAGVREYFADANRLWEELTLHAEDVRSAPGSVVVFGHVEGCVDGERLTRRVVWTWRLRDGKAVWMRANDLGPAA